MGIMAYSSSIKGDTCHACSAMVLSRCHGARSAVLPRSRTKSQAHELVQWPLHYTHKSVPQRLREMFCAVVLSAHDYLLISGKPSAFRSIACSSPAQPAPNNVVCLVLRPFRCTQRLQTILCFVQGISLDAWIVGSCSAEPKLIHPKHTDELMFALESLKSETRDKSIAKELALETCISKEFSLEVW